MIGDPLKLFLPLGGTAQWDALVTACDTGVVGLDAADMISLHLLDLTSNGGSVRLGKDSQLNKVKMTISHSETKENLPYVTRRSVVRLDRQKVDVNGKTVTQSAYFVTVDPVSGTLFSGAGETTFDLLQLLTFFGLFGPVVGTEVDALEESPRVIHRILDGEP